MSKGSKRRPTDEKKFKDNWEKIFNANKNKRDSTVSVPDCITDTNGNKVRRKS